MGRSVVIFGSIPKSNFWRVFDVFSDLCPKNFRPGQSITLYSGARYMALWASRYLFKLTEILKNVHIGWKKNNAILRGSVKNNWELSYISKTMKQNLLKFGMFIEQSYLHNPSKEWTTQRDVIQCDVILGDVILWFPFAQWKTEKLKRKVWILYWKWMSSLK